MADIDQLLSTILAKQEPRQQQFRDDLAEEERRKTCEKFRSEAWVRLETVQKNFLPVLRGFFNFMSILKGKTV